MSENGLAFPIHGKDGKEGGSFMFCRDQTRNLTELEQCAFRRSRTILLNVLHLFLTFDDDLFNIYTNDIQVKILCSQKVDNEGYSVDTVANALLESFYG